MNDLLYVFIIAFFLAGLYYLNDGLENEKHKLNGWKIFIFLALVKSLLAGVVGFVIYYALISAKIEVIVFDKAIMISDGVAVFISVVIPFFFNQIIDGGRGFLAKRLQK